MYRAGVVPSSRRNNRVRWRVLVPAAAVSSGTE